MAFRVTHISLKYYYRIYVYIIVHFLRGIRVIAFTQMICVKIVNFYYVHVIHMKVRYITYPWEVREAVPYNPLIYVQYYFTCLIYTGWPFAVAREWTKFVDTNVCAVDWSILSRQDYLIAAQLNTRLVGYYIAEFITQLVRNDISPDDISVAGHSLGGQIVGFVGQNLINRNITLGRLYGCIYCLFFIFH